MTTPTLSPIQSPAYTIVVTVPGGFISGHDLKRNQVTITGDRSQAFEFSLLEDAQDFVHYWNLIEDSGLSTATCSIEWAPNV